MEVRFRLLFLCLCAAERALLTIGVNHGDTIGDAGSSFFFYQDQMYPRDCKEIQDQCSTQNSTGAHLIQPDGHQETFWVYCSGEWTVIQRRFDGYLDFNRSWAEYRDGFGFINVNHWLGTEKLAYLTNQKNYELLIEIETKSGVMATIFYDSFRINDEFSGYALVSLGQRSGTTDSTLLQCPANMVYGNCNRCIATCADPTGTVDCSNDCSDIPWTCICPTNYLIDGSDCVRLEQCGCYKAGYGVIADNDIQMTSDCSERCECSAGVLTCERTSCGQNAICKIMDGVRGCYCIEGYFGDGQTCTLPYGDCYDLWLAGHMTSGDYVITPPGWDGEIGEDFVVNCNMTIDGGGWTVIQRRSQSSSRLSFDHNWQTYKEGFGTPSGEFWIGNEKLFYLTNQKEYELRIDMVEYSTRRQFYAKYNLFRINGESDKYKLTGLGTYTGTAGDSLRYHHQMYFTTLDRDNDRAGDNCADGHNAGWWYNNCSLGNPNYSIWSAHFGYWNRLPTLSYLIYSDMKIRPKQTN